MVFCLYLHVIFFKKTYSMRFFSVILFVLILFISSCKDPNEYRVDNEFAPYLQRFEDSALVRKKNFDVLHTGLIIEFGDLKDNVVGLTHYEDPIRIQIDRTYWNAISSTAGADFMKEDLIFHELGHGLLGRSHINSTLENGDWKSIMCGGDKVGNRPWNINYKGIRRSYYIKELFDESTSAPDFSSNQLIIDTTGYTPKLQLTFNTTLKKDFGWDIVDDANHKISFDNGRMCFQSKLNQILYMFAQTSLNIQSDFSFELNIQYSASDLSGQYGLVFGKIPSGSLSKTDSVEYFGINNNQKMYMGNYSWYTFYTELAENKILSGGGNKLKIFKQGNMLYYFINDSYCYCSEIEVKGNGYGFGFSVPPNGTVWIDNFSLSQRLSSGVKSNIKQEIQITGFKCVTAEPFQFSINKK